LVLVHLKIMMQYYRQRQRLTTTNEQVGRIG